MNQKKNIYCLTPIYNDWESFAILIQEIYQLTQNLSTYDFFIVAVNDGSTQDLPEDFVCPLCGVGKDQFEEA